MEEKIKCDIIPLFINYTNNLKKNTHIQQSSFFKHGMIIRNVQLSTCCKKRTTSQNVFKFELITRLQSLCFVKVNLLTFSFQVIFKMFFTVAKSQKFAELRGRIA